MRTVRRLLPLMLALALLTAGCHPNGDPVPTPPTPSPTPSVAPTPAPVERAFTLPYDPGGGWDPYNGVTTTNLPLLGLISRSLYTLDGTFTPRPDLVSSAAESENGLVWTFTLHDAALSDGAPLTPSLVANAINAARAEPSLYAPRLSGVRRVTSSESGAVTITLASPNHNLPALLDFPIVVNGESGVLGAGPYRVEGDRLTQNPYWAGGSLPVDTIPLAPVGDAADLLSAFHAGNVSLAPTHLASPDAADPAGAQVWDYPTTQLLFMGFSCDAGPTKDPAFRQALSQALDRDALASSLLKGHAVAASLPVHPASPLYDAHAAALLSCRPAAAGAALDELGYPRSEEDGLRYFRRAPLTLTLLLNSDSALHTAAGDWVAAQLAQAGITVQLSALPFADYQTALQKGEFDLYLAQARLTADGDLAAFLDKGGALAYGVSADQALRDALTEGKKTGDFAPFYSLWAQAPTCAPLVFQNASLLTHWGGVQPKNMTQGNLFADFVNWTL